MNKDFNEIKHVFTEKDQSNRKGKTFGLNARTREEVSRLTRMFSGRSLQEFKEYCVTQGKTFVYTKKYAELLKDVFSTQTIVQQAPIKVLDRNTELLELLLNKVEELTKRVEEQSKRIESLEAALTEEDETVIKAEKLRKENQNNLLNYKWEV